MEVAPFYLSIVIKYIYSLGIVLLHYRLLFLFAKSP